MAANEPVQGGPYPEPSDAPDGPNQLKAIVDWATTRLVMRFASTTARDAAITSPVAGMVAVTGDGATQAEWLYSGTEWLETWSANAGRPYRQDAGVTTITLSNSDLGTQAVDFAADRFTQTPVVIATVRNSLYIASTQTPTTSGVTLQMRHYEGQSVSTSQPVMWYAVQMTP